MISPQRFLAAGICCAALWTACSPPATRQEIPEIPKIPADSAASAALVLARSNLASAPLSADAWGRYGQRLDAANLAAPAELCYSNASRLDPASARWRHLLALKQLRLNPDEALANLREAAHRDGPSNDAPRIRLAQALFERGRPQDAVTALEPLLSSQTNHAAARLEFARATAALGRFEESIAALAPCLTNPYTAKYAHALLGQAFLRTGNSNAAQRHAKIAASLPKPFDWPDPYLREIQNIRLDSRRQNEQANTLLQQRRNTEAEAVLDAVLKQDPNDTEALLLMGRLRLQQRRCPEAEALLRQHLSRGEESLNGWVQLGMALYCQSRWDDAARAFETAGRLKPDFGPAAYNLGLCQSRLGNSARAIESFQHAIRCSPGDIASHAALAEELLRAGNRTEARRHADRAAALDPAHPKVRGLLDALQRER